MNKIDLYLEKVKNVKNIGANQYSAICPCHNDENNSLNITEKNGKVLLNCFAGCDYKTLIEYFIGNNNNFNIRNNIANSKKRN